jgi:hypothetical protein
MAVGFWVGRRVGVGGRVGTSVGDGLAVEDGLAGDAAEETPDAVAEAATDEVDEALGLGVGELQPIRRRAAIVTPLTGRIESRNARISSKTTGQIVFGSAGAHVAQRAPWLGYG